MTANPHTSVLGTTRAADLAAGSILRGELDAAPWRFALPAGADDRLTWHGPETGFEADLAALDSVTAVARVPGDGPEIETGGVRLRFGADGPGWDLVHRDGRLVAVLPRGQSASDPAAADLLPAGVLGQATTRHPVAVTGAEPGPPRWLMAAVDTDDLTGRPWALWCRGDYGSQKLILFVGPAGSGRDDGDPGLAVKIVRQPRFNARLDNETAVLRQLEPLSVLLDPEPRAGGGGAAGPDRAAPRVVAAGTVWGSSFCAQSVLAGSALPGAIRRPGGWDLVDRGAEWLGQLARATARPAEPGTVAEAVADLHQRWVTAFRPEPGPARAVEAALDPLLRQGDQVPVVLEHGDPGPWNALVTPRGTVAFLDWEAGERAGLPLWDQLYFLRSAALTYSRRRWHSRRRTVRRHLIDGSPLTPSIAAHLGRTSTALGLEPPLVAALIHACWLHRAVKQAARLSPGQAATASYHQLLLDGVAGAGRRGFRTLCRPGAGAEARS